MAWAQIEAKVELDTSDIEFSDDTELQEFIESHFYELDTDAAIDIAMGYCNPTRFVKLMFERMSKDQCFIVIEDYFQHNTEVKTRFFKKDESNLNMSDLLAKYLKQVNPNWKDEYPLNLSTIAFLLERLIRTPEFTSKPAEV